MAEESGAKCQRCQQALPAGTGYCVACGCDNTDIVAKKFGALQESQKRIERAGLLRKIFRFLRFGR